MKWSGKFSLDFLLLFFFLKRKLGKVKRKERGHFRSTIFMVIAGIPPSKDMVTKKQTNKKQQKN